MLAHWSRLKKVVFGITCFGCLFVAAMICQVQFSFLDRIHGASDVPSAQIGLILGASIEHNGQPSLGLLNRLKTGADLYKQGKVHTLMITGDDGQFVSNEIQPMENTLFALGVNRNDIVVDGHGYRTYESCRRAKYVYGIDQAILITQRFHISRALFLCERLGMDVYGAVAPAGEPKATFKSTLRDILASVKAYIDIYFIRPTPVFPSVANRIFEEITTTTTSP